MAKMDQEAHAESLEIPENLVMMVKRVQLVTVR
jgi:hypothetical protein